MLSAERVPQTRLAAIKFYATVEDAAAQRGPDIVRFARRWLARNDLFYLLTVLCKRKDLNRDWLFDRCREVFREPNGRLDLWAREHYKSTIITFGLLLQDILASHGEDPEPRYDGREVTIGILSFSKPSAKGFLRQLKYEMESNDELKALFDDVLWSNPQRQAPKWSEDDGLIVIRKTNPKEATVEAHGLVDGQPVGKHFFIINYDDVVTQDNVSPEMILKTTQAWELSNSLGTEGGHKRYIGTRYAMFDTYRTMMERGIKPRIHACTSDGSEDWTKSVLMSPTTLAEKRQLQGPYTFGAQMLLDPTADKQQGFRQEWLDYWPATELSNLNRLILVDPAGSKKRKTNDYTTMWVLGLGGDRKVRVIDVVRDRLNLVERQRMLFTLHRTHRPYFVGYEQYGLQADIEHHKSIMERENYQFTITELGGSLDKHSRITRLVPWFERKDILLPERGVVRTDYEGRSHNLIRVFIEEEYEPFPTVTHDDMLDALSRIADPEVPLTFPVPKEETTAKWMEELMAEGEERDWMTA